MAPGRDRDGGHWRHRLRSLLAALLLDDRRWSCHSPVHRGSETPPHRGSGFESHSAHHHRGPRTRTAEKRHAPPADESPRSPRRTTRSAEGGGGGGATTKTRVTEWPDHPIACPPRAPVAGMCGRSLATREGPGSRQIPTGLTDRPCFPLGACGRCHRTDGCSSPTFQRTSSRLGCDAVLTSRGERSVWSTRTRRQT